MQAKTGRNDPCPCGSGRKFKHCCLGAPAGAGGRGAPLAAGPGAAELFQQGLQLQAAGQPAAAAERFRAVLRQAPDNVEAHVNLGNALIDLAQPAAALASYQRALQLRPAMRELNLNIGLAQEALGQDAVAAATYEAALAHGPASAQVLNNLARLLRKAGRLDESIVRWRAAIALEPAAAALHDGLAGVLSAQGRVDQAVDSLRTAIALDPSSADLQENLGLVLLQLGDVHGAVLGLRQALAIDPQRYATHQSLLMLLLYLDSSSPASIAAEHRAFASRFTDALAPRHGETPRAPDPERPLHIGYVSGDFRSHSVAYFIEPILARHDRARHTVTCYHTLAVEDEVTARLRALADRWVACAGLDDEALAARVRADRIDILVDLSGHTAGNRLRVFARRPAPLQLSWIGYPAASGLWQIDARLSDDVASPPGPDAAPHATPGGAYGGLDAADRIVRLPRVFSVYRPPRDAPPADRLPPEDPSRIELGSFNNLAKVSNTTLRLWCAVLRRNPALHLTLKDKLLGAEAARVRLLERFAAHGIGAERLTLLARLPADRDHLERYRQLDIALDTYPYGGVTTTCEALWMGLPVVSLAGAGFAARMGATLLGAIGQSGWVAHDEGEFVDIVLALAADPQLRGARRGALRAALAASALCDEAGVTGELEAAYRALWTGCCAAAGVPAGLAP